MAVCGNHVEEGGLVSRFKGLQYSYCANILKENGWVLYARGKGSHVKFTKGCSMIVITENSRGVNRMLWRRLCKENNIKED